MDVDHGLIHSNKFTEVLTLWARTLRPSAARVTSVKLSLEKRRPKTLSKLFEWLFHLRQNWCDGVILIRVSLRPSIFEEFFVFFFSNLAPNFSSKKFNSINCFNFVVSRWSRWTTAGRPPVGKKNGTKEKMIKNEFSSADTVSSG